MLRRYRRRLVGQAANDFVAALGDGGKMVDLPGVVSVRCPADDTGADDHARVPGMPAIPTTMPLLLKSSASLVLLPDTGPAGGSPSV